MKNDLKNLEKIGYKKTAEYTNTYGDNLIYFESDTGDIMCTLEYIDFSNQKVMKFFRSKEHANRDFEEMQEDNYMLNYPKWYKIN